MCKKRMTLKELIDDIKKDVSRVKKKDSNPNYEIKKSSINEENKSGNSGGDSE